MSEPRKTGPVVEATALPPAISPGLIADLKRSEGCRRTAYPDPVSGDAPWTIGYGHTHGVKEGDVWTQAQCEAALIADIQEAMRQLDARLPWWRSLDPVRADCMTELCFNLGIGALCGFTNALAALKARDFKRAAAALLASRWAVQVGQRANRLAQMVASGLRPPG